MSKNHLVVPEKQEKKPSQTFYFCDLPPGDYKKTKSYLECLFICFPELPEALREYCHVSFFILESCFGLNEKGRITPKEILREIKRNEWGTSNLEEKLGILLCTLQVELSFHENIQEKALLLRQKLFSNSQQQARVQVFPFQYSIFEFLRGEMEKQGKKIFGWVVWYGNYSKLLDVFIEEQGLDPKLKGLKKWLYDQVLCLSRRGLIVSSRKRGQSSRPAYYWLNVQADMDLAEKENYQIARKLKEAKMSEGITKKAVLYRFVFGFLSYFYGFLRNKEIGEGIENGEALSPAESPQVSFSGSRPIKEIMLYFETEYHGTITDREATKIWAAIIAHMKNRPDGKQVLITPGNKGKREYTLFNPLLVAEEGDNELPIVANILSENGAPIKESKKEKEVDFVQVSKEKLASLKKEHGLKLQGIKDLEKQIEDLQNQISGLQNGLRTRKDQAEQAIKEMDAIQAMLMVFEPNVEKEIDPHKVFN